MATITTNESAAPAPSLAGTLISRYWKICLRLAAGAALVGYLALHTQWGPVTTAVRGLNWKCWLAALLLNLFSQIASAWRWSVLARPLGFAFSRLHICVCILRACFSAFVCRPLLAAMC